MKRLTEKSSKMVRLANNVIRPSIWILSRLKDTVDGEVKTIYRYGENRVVVYGQLFEEDCGTLLCLMELSRRAGSKSFDFSLSDLAKLKGVKNPYQPTSLKPIRESIDRLLDVHVRIRPTKEKGLSAAFKFVSGWMNTDTNRGNLSLSPYFEQVRTLALGTTLIPLDSYYSIPSQLGRSLYKFLLSQRKFYDGEGYEIRLSRLVEYLNYDHGSRPWFKIREDIHRVTTELKRLGLVSRFRYVKNRCGADGGVYKFWPGRKQPRKRNAGESPDTTTSIEQLRALFPSGGMDVRGTEQQYRKALNGLERYLKAEYPTTTFKYFLRDYCWWLDGKAKYILPSVFRVGNSFFDEFVKEEREYGKMLNRKEVEQDRRLAEQDAKETPEKLEQRRKEERRAWLES